VLAHVAHHRFLLEVQSCSMCGRVYQTYTEEEFCFQYLNKRPLVPLKFTPVYNLCPTQNSPVLRLIDSERQFDEMRLQIGLELGGAARDFRHRFSQPIRSSVIQPTNN